MLIIGARENVSIVLCLPHETDLSGNDLDLICKIANLNC